MSRAPTGVSIRTWMSTHPVPTAIGVGGGALVAGAVVSIGIGLVRGEESAAAPSASADRIALASGSPTESVAPIATVSSTPTHSPSPSPAPTRNPTSQTDSAPPSPTPAATPNPTASPAPPTSAALPSSIPGVGRVAWGASGSGSSDIVVVAGAETYRVAATEAEETNPVWSPDGEWLAYISSAAGGSVLVIGPDGERVLHEGSYPTSSYYTDGVGWSPDSSLIALALVPGGIKIVDLDGVTVREIGAAEPRHVAWSPAGDLLTFTSGRQLRVADVVTGETRVVTSMDSNIRFPMWLNDGQTIVFHGYTEAGNTDLFAVGLDGSGLRNITATNDLFEDVPVLSPDGSRIAMVVEGVSDRWVEVMNADGSERVRTGMTMRGIGALVWRPDGAELLVADGTSIYEVPVEPDLPSFLIGHGTAPSWGRHPD